MKGYTYSYPFLPVSGQVIDSASTKLRFRELSDLAGSISVGIYDADTQSIATGSGNGNKFFIGYSSEHTKDFIDKYLHGATLAKGNTGWDFKGNDVMSFEYSDPTYLRNERYVIGWSGTDGCDEALPKFKTGKPVGVKIRAYGPEISKRWNGDFVREYYSKSFPRVDTSGCVNGQCPDEFVSPKEVFKSIAEKINSDYETKQIYLKARVISSDYSTTVANMNIYEIAVQDAGDNNALAKVQATVPKPFKVERVNRVGLVSVYNVCSLTAPEDFQPDPQGYFTTDCDGCNQVLSGATYYDVYTVTVTADAATDIDTEGKRDTIISTKTTGYGGTDGTYVSHDGTELVFTFRKVAGTAAPTAAGTDEISAEVGSAFTLAMPDVIEWTEKCDAYRTSRELCITLPRLDCATGNRLQELKDFYASYPDVDADNITVTSTSDCQDTYKMTQYGEGCLTDSCLAAATDSFADVSAYEDSAWTPVVVASSTAFDPDSVGAVKAGLEISVNFPKTFVNDDEFNPWKDNTDLEPVRLEVSMIYDPFDELPGFGDIPVGKRVSKASSIRQSGFTILQQYIKANGAYQPFGMDYKKAEFRRVLDSNLRQQVERTSPYRVYYLKVRINRNNTNITQKAEIAEITFAVPLTRPDKMAKLEAAILAPLSRFGVELKKRG